jgi:hypothetical protein
MILKLNAVFRYYWHVGVLIYVCNLALNLDRGAIATFGTDGTGFDLLSTIH